MDIGPKTRFGRGRNTFSDVEVWIEREADRERAGIVLRDIESGARKGDVACGGCGESSPANFDLCWNCGQGLEGAG